MKQWIEQNKVALWLLPDNDKGKPIYAIPVSALEELFSKEGEELARDMCIILNDVCYEGRAIPGYTEDMFHKNWEQAFIEAYNLQQVKIEALKKDVEELRGVLGNLVQLKDWKDKHGKDGHYLTNVDNAWLHARLTLNPKQ